MIHIGSLQLWSLLHVALQVLYGVGIILTGIPGVAHNAGNFAGATVGCARK